MSEGGGTSVAIDSMTLVWGVRQQGTQEQLRRAKWLFQQLEEEEAQIILPSVALAEYLTAIEAKDHPDVIASLSERLLIFPFDVRCASLAATLFREGATIRRKGVPGWRECLRADSLIIATAAVHGAKRFYSGDTDCRELARKHTKMAVQDIPSIAPSLYSDLEEPPAIIRAPKQRQRRRKK